MIDLSSPLTSQPLTANDTYFVRIPRGYMAGYSITGTWDGATISVQGDNAYVYATHTADGDDIIFPDGTLYFVLTGAGASTSLSIKSNTVHKGSLNLSNLIETGDNRWTNGVDEAFVEYATMGWWVGSVTCTVTDEWGDATYVGFTTKQSTYGIIRLDNLTGRHNVTILGYGAGRDDHNVPTVAQLFDGRMIVGWTDHGQEAVVKITISKSKNMDDWWYSMDVPTGGNATYPSFHVVGSHLQLWYRAGGATTGNHRLRRVDMNTQNIMDITSWEAEQTVFDTEYILWKEDTAATARYQAFIAQHPVAGTDHNIYYAYVHETTDIILKPGGTQLGDIFGTNLPLAGSAGQLAVNAGGGNNSTRTLDGGRNSAGLPCVLYARFDKTTSGAAAVGTYYMGNYVNSSSTFAELALGATGAPAEVAAGANFYFGGMCIHTDNPNKIYRISESSGTWTLDELVINGGLSAISSTTALYSVSGGKKLLRPYYENGWVFFTEFDFYTDYTNFGGRVRKIWVGK